MLRLTKVADHMGLAVVASPVAALSPGLGPVRIAICGVGGMGMGHHRNITGGDVPTGKVVGVCDVDPAKLEAHKEYGYEMFTDSDELIAWAAAGNADAYALSFSHPPARSLP